MTSLGVMLPVWHLSNRAVLHHAGCSSESPQWAIVRATLHSSSCFVGAAPFSRKCPILPCSISAQVYCVYACQYAFWTLTEYSWSFLQRGPARFFVYICFRCACNEPETLCSKSAAAHMLSMHCRRHSVSLFKERSLGKHETRSCQSAHISHSYVYIFIVTVSFYG